MTADWTPYRPPWYPAQGDYDNPWSTDPATYQSGHKTYYTTWMESLPEDELMRLIVEYRNRPR